jgi:hypothetical protein
MIKKVIHITLIALFVSCAGRIEIQSQENKYVETSFFPGEYLDYTDIIEAESQWIASLQTSRGAILLNRNQNASSTFEGKSVIGQIEPYFSNLALIGLLDNPTSRNMGVTKNWIEWYLAHLNSEKNDYNGLRGTVYRYYVDYSDDSIEYSDHNYDSTDSYAATFLSLVKKYLEKSGDKAYVKSIEENLKIIADAIITTQMPDGLTWAKPDYKIKYLMDNCEVYAGLKDYSWILHTIDASETEYHYYYGKMLKCREGIEQHLWNEENNSYNWHLNGMSKWEKWYPESGAQTFPLYFGVLESKSDRAKQLYNALNQHYPEWPEKGHWALQANAAVMMGDYQRAERFISSVQELYLKERKWPWRSSEAGFLIAAAHKIRENANLAYQASISSSNKENEVLTLLNDRLLENEFILPGTEKEKWISFHFDTPIDFNELKIIGEEIRVSKLPVKISSNGKDFTKVTFNQRGNHKSRFVGLGKNVKHIQIDFSALPSTVKIKEIEIYQTPPKTYDLVVYGATSAGVMSAIAAAREGLSVILVANGGHIGGMTSGGLGYVDVGKSFTIGGLTHNFFERNATYHGGHGVNYRVTPSAAESLFLEMLSEYDIDLIFNSRLHEKTSIHKLDGRIQSIILESGQEIKGRYFIDSSYEGDLMAASGVSYVVGRESRNTYHEPGAGKQDLYTFKQLDPYDEENNLLPDIYIGKAGKVGTGDNKSQAYNFRLCLTQDPQNFVSIGKPTTYNPKRYELLLQTILRSTSEINLSNIVSIAKLPDGKTDFNNNGMFSTDLINGSWSYAESNYKQRDSIWTDHKDYLQGLFYFLGNDPRVPKSLREEVLSWGLSKDEFIDTENWPHQLYIREGRRMIGEYVMTQFDAWDNAKKNNSVGMGSYMIDSHYVRKFVDKKDGILKMEGLTGHQPVRPYEIPYSSITPQKEQCENLLVPVCMSASHVMYGSLRMEPVYMILGESAGTAIAQAFHNSSQAVQEIDVTKLQEKLDQNGQILSHDGGVYLKSDFKGVILDDSDASFKGDWGTSSNSIPFMESSGYRYTLDQSLLSEAIYKTTIQHSGNYDIYCLFAPGANRASNAKVIINSPNETIKLMINMKQNIPDETYPFVKVCRLFLKPDDPIEITITNEEADGIVVADAFLISRNEIEKRISN